MRLPQPTIEKSADGETATLTDFYTVDCWPVSVRICPGFAFDGASIPTALRPFVGGPWDARRLPAATVHDWLYASHATPRPVADLVFLRLLLANGMPPIRAMADWWAVVRFGASAWASHGEDTRRWARDLGMIIFSF